MKALSVRAPWWWFILYGGKDIENRNWPTRFRGRVYLHASSWFRLDDVAFDANVAVGLRIAAGTTGAAETTFREMKASGGCIVGSVEIVGCVKSSDSPWFFGSYGLQLANPIAFARPVKCKGALSFFPVPTHVVAEIARTAYLPAVVSCGGDDEETGTCVYCLLPVEQCIWKGKHYPVGDENS